MTESPVIGRPRWTTLATVGLLLASVGPGLFLIAGLVWGLEDATFFIPSFVVGLVTAFLVRRFGTWAKVLGVIVALLIGFMLFWTAFGLFVPGSFFDFVPGLLVIPGALIAIVSCIAAIAAKRRGHLIATATGGERTTIRVIVGVVGVLALISGILTFAGRSTVEDAAAASSTASVMKEFEFRPTVYTVRGGSTIFVKNDDPFMHTFTVDALGIDVVLGPWSEKLVTIPTTPGTYVLYCEPHGDPTPDEDTHEGAMNGTLTVT